MIMRILKSITFFGILSCAPFSGGQGTFQNLNFEQANPVSDGLNSVTAASALPGWTLYCGSVQQTSVTYNTYSLGQANVSLFGPGWNQVNPGIIDGNYTVALQAGAGPAGQGEDNTSMWQDGTIPANAQTLEFSAWNFEGTVPLTVSFAGNTLPIVILSSGMSSSGQSYNVYGADIAPYANQTGQLEFTATFYNWVELDDIAFSSTAVPEPNPAFLAGIGGLLFALYRRFARPLR